MHLECFHWAHRLDTASEGDPRGRGNAGSGDLADHKTTAWTQTCVSGGLRYPLDATVTAGGRPGSLGDDKALCRLARKEAVPGAGKPGRHASWMVFRWDEEPWTCIAGYHGARRAHGGRIWREERNIRPLLQSKVRRVETY